MNKVPFEMNKVPFEMNKQPSEFNKITEGVGINQKLSAVGKAFIILSVSNKATIIF